MRKGVFFERDGIVVKRRLIDGRPSLPRSLKEFHLNPLVFDMFRRFKEAGLILVITTNQPGLADGSMERRELDRMHHLLRDRLPVDDILFCPHPPGDRCPCHKPRPGLFIEAARHWCFSLPSSYVVSDH